MSSPMEQERFRSAKQQGMSEEQALRHSLSKGGATQSPGLNVHGGGAKEGAKGMVKSPGLNVHGSGNKEGAAGATKNVGASPVVVPPGHRISSMEIRPAGKGVIVKHSFERIPGEPSRSGSSGAAPQQDDLVSNQPQEHAFGSSEEAMDHVGQNLGSLLNRGGSGL